MEEMHKVFKAVEGYREEVIRLQSELTRRVALGPANGGTGEHEKAAFLLAELEALAPDFVEEIRAPEEGAADGYRPNLVASWKGDREGPGVWVLSHMDVVPGGDNSLWSGDPYSLRVDGDRLYGRGVEDDHHGIVSSLLAVKALRDSGVSPGRPVGLVMVADEETGNRCGLGYILAHRGGLFSREDLIIVPDAGNEDGTMIEVAEKSVLWLRFTVKGKQCHASTPSEGGNSLYGAARLVVELDSLRKRFDAVDPLFIPPESTFVPTKIEANVPNINTAPGRDVFYMDCRVLPRYPLSDIISAARDSADSVASELGLTVNLESVKREEAPEPTPVDAPVVKVIQRAFRKVTGLEAVPSGIGGGTVASLFRAAGLPAAVWMTSRNTAHQGDECCLVSDILKDAKVFASIFLERSE